MVRYAYIRQNKSNKSGVITIASEIDNTTGKKHFGIAFCSPKDIFNKKLARKIAIGRLNKHTSKFHMTGNKDTKLHTVLQACLALSHTPRWAKRIIFQINKGQNK